jgi:hypothetical protein
MISAKREEAPIFGLQFVAFPVSNRLTHASRRLQPYLRV